MATVRGAKLPAALVVSVVIRRSAGGSCRVKIDLSGLVVQLVRDDTNDNGYE